MALVLGTTSGFVTTSPTGDPGGSSSNVIDDSSAVTKDISPSGATKITEIGWWCTNATQEANFEVGLYAADGAVVPNEAGTLLHVSRTNAKGTALGWKTVAVDWEISEDTDYWIGMQLDNTSSSTVMDRQGSGGSGIDYISSGQSTLNDPYGGGSLFDSDGMWAIYALVEIGGDVTVEPSTLTLSTTEEDPAYFIDITKGPVAMSATLLAPTLSISNAPFVPDTLELTLSVLTPTINPPDVEVTTTKISGSFATIPYEEPKPIINAVVESAQKINSQFNDTLGRL